MAASQAHAHLRAASTIVWHRRPIQGCNTSRLANDTAIHVLHCKHAGVHAGAPDDLAQPLRAMGYTAKAVAAAHAATQSSDISRNIDWLVSNPLAASAAGAQAMQQSHGQQQQARAKGTSRYPDIEFASAQQPALRQPAAAIQSHPVTTNSLYGTHTPGYSDDTLNASNPLLACDSDNAPQDAGAAGPAGGDRRYVGMAGLIHGRRAEAEQLTEAVQSGFQDLEVCHVGACLLACAKLR